MKYAIFLSVFVFALLTSCSTTSQSDEGSGTASEWESSSYQAWVRVNGSIYVSQGVENDGTYTREEKVGNVQYKLPFDQSIKENFASNYLEEGADIFAIQEEASILLGETEEGTFEIMEKEDD
ncbi:hypothetical protein [Salibacterium halotolerans]|uniref:DUF306 domain-containing protein n=1 Tax=Salibacterium halotolerans TaxID=1884432 RepID=A0A1I5S7G8_9BACI|nr:hypothetical protein [Salibacterium halotolerans]SFP66683.1 hypothetical protein SAMN05518683_10879 [Salibacterium halotolerans]